MNSIDKYGIENFDVDKIFDTAKDLEELNEKEIYWINFYKSNNPLYGYNETIGGEGRIYNNILKFIKRYNGSKNYNKYITSLILKFRKCKDGIWDDNIGFGVNNNDKELIRYYAWNDKKLKQCKYCNKIYYRKYDRNNLCDFCNILCKEDIKEIKKIIKIKVD